MTTLEAIQEAQKRSQERRAAHPRTPVPFARAKRPEALSRVTVNIPAMLAQHHLVTEEISALKKTIRTSGHNITWQEAKRLKGLKWDATALCILSARLRGRLHIPASVYSVEQQDSVAIESASRLPRIEKSEAA